MSAQSTAHPSEPDPSSSGSAAPIGADAIRVPGSRTLRFEGIDHGSGISFYLVTNDPGQGPALHRHPYTETWTVLEGEATIRLGETSLVAGAGDTAVVQPHTWHGFTNTGTGTLRIMCIHASPELIQEEFDPDGGLGE